MADKKMKPDENVLPAEGCLLLIIIMIGVMLTVVKEPSWLFAFLMSVLLVTGVLPIVTYFTIRLGVYAYHRAKYLAGKDCGENVKKSKDDELKPWEKN